MRHARLLEGQGLENWAVLNLCRNLNGQQVETYARDLGACCTNLGRFSFLFPRGIIIYWFGRHGP